MSGRGLDIAREHGERQPAFSSASEAKAALLSLRDQRLAQVRAWTHHGGAFAADATPESLKALEAWYFDVLEGGAAALNATIGELDGAVGAYFGQVLVDSAGFEWVVEQNAFVPGHYELGVRRGLCTLMLTDGWAPEPLKRNKRKQSLLRQFKKYAA
jgi:hypothetical protein